MVYLKECILDNRSYVLITPARNEEAYIEKVIQSVTCQTIPPEKWIIVSDGSTDRTDEIVNKYVEKYDFIKLLSIKGDAQRNFGSKVRAFNTGYEQLKHIEYEFIGNLDADISFVPDYYERILNKFQQNPKLGLAGGFIYEEYNDKFKSRLFNSVRSVPHAIQFFRGECYELIGGFIPLRYGGVDWCAEVMVRMKGWQVESFPEIKVFHHRHTGTSDGKLRGIFREGIRAYSVGSHPLFEIFKCLSRFKGKPYLVYGLFRTAGFIWGYFRREKRMVSDEFVKHIRREQMQRLQSLFSKSPTI